MQNKLTCFLQNLPGTPNNGFFCGCFNWMIPNHYITNCCFTKHPLKNGCLGYRVGKIPYDSFKLGPKTGSKSSYVPIKVRGFF